MSVSKVAPLKHYEPVVQKVAFQGGSGVIMPGQKPKADGVIITAKMPYADVPMTAAKAKLDEAKRTITIKVDGKSRNQFHSNMVPSFHDTFVPVSYPSQIGKNYKIIVEDRTGHVLKSSTFKLGHHL